MSENNDDKSVNDGKPTGFMGSGSGAGYILAAIGAAAGLAWFMWGGPSRAPAPQEAGQVRPGTPGRPFVPPPPPAQAEAPRDPPADPRPRDAGEGAGRPRASPMVLSVRRERPAPTGTAAQQEPKPETVAGMPVLTADMVADAENFLMPGDKLSCLSAEPLEGKADGVAFTTEINEDFIGRGNAWPPLIPKGSLAFGRVSRVAEDGDERIAAALTLIRGPSVIGRPTLMVPLGDAQPGEPLGDAGLRANVETRFWARLGTVAAYAGLDAVGRIGSSLAGNAINEGLSGGGRTNINVGNFGGMASGRSLAGSAFDHELRRGPRLSRPQAQPCTIFITKPIRVRGTPQRGR